jgi:imidazole glycerol phosphate synthase glutamine amidotransferase subunit
VTALIAYGGGNLRSLRNALLQLGVAGRAVSSPRALEQAGRIILPGVGHFGALMRALDARGLRDPLVRRIRAGVPFLGICLGFQALFESSAEAPGVRGLGIVAGHVGALTAAPRLPHMGWNQVTPLRPTRLLAGLPGLPCFYFAHSYAVRGDGRVDSAEARSRPRNGNPPRSHSFAGERLQPVVPLGRSQRGRGGADRREASGAEPPIKTGCAWPVGPAAAAVSDCGEAFTAVFESGNCAGVQFHPEKSGAAGLRLLANFLQWKPPC